MDQSFKAITLGYCEVMGTWDVSCLVIILKVDLIRNCLLVISNCSTFAA